MKRIGITGGIGAGKSVASRLFAMLGVPVYDADRAAKRLMEENPTLKQEISNRFGTEVYDAEGRLDRARLAQHVFGNEIALEELNRMVHPRVMEDYTQWNLMHSDSDYTLREAAILYESETWHDLDEVILVDAPESLRLQRTMQRDRRSEAEVRQIMSRQWSSEKKRALARHIIENDERHALIPQVLRIDAAIRTYTHPTHASS